MTDPLSVQAGYARALRAGDAGAATAMFAPGGVIWHNYDDREVPADRASRVLTVLRDAMPDLDWEDVAVEATPSGFVWRAVVVGTAAGGPVRAHTCMVVTVSSDGLIERLDEYLDPAAMAPLRSGA